MFTLKLRQRFWKMFDSWATANTPRERQRRTVKLRLEVLEDRVVPATWYVAGTGDAGQGMKNPQGGGGEGDLRFCMSNAASGDTILFGVSGTIAINSQLPTINQQNLKIDGSGQNVEIWGGGNYGILMVGPRGIAEIDNLSIDDGYVSGTDGGGLFNAGNLTLKNDTFLNNQAASDIDGKGGDGGAIYNEIDATLTMVGVSLNSNTTSNHGGGIRNDGNLTCQGHCSIVQNKASYGGGVYASSAKLEQGIQITGNQATSWGGGIYKTGTGKLTVTGFSLNAAINGNSAPTGGGRAYA